MLVRVLGMQRQRLCGSILCQSNAHIYIQLHTCSYTLQAWCLSFTVLLLKPRRNRTNALNLLRRPQRCLKLEFWWCEFLIAKVRFGSYLVVHCKPAGTGLARSRMPWVHHGISVRNWPWCSLDWRSCLTLFEQQTPLVQCLCDTVQFRLPSPYRYCKE